MIKTIVSGVKLQYFTPPTKADAVYAKKIQELIGGTFQDLPDKKQYAYQFLNNSEGQESAEGRWAKGPSMDGKGEFEFVANLEPLGPIPTPPPGEPKLHTTSEMTQPQTLNSL